MDELNKAIYGTDMMLDEELKMRGIWDVGWVWEGLKDAVVDITKEIVDVVK